MCVPIFRGCSRHSSFPAPVTAPTSPHLSHIIIDQVPAQSCRVFIGVGKCTRSRSNLPRTSDFSPRNILANSLFSHLAIPGKHECLSRRPVTSSIDGKPWSRGTYGVALARLLRRNCLVDLPCSFLAWPCLSCTLAPIAALTLSLDLPTS